MDNGWPSTVSKNIEGEQQIDAYMLPLRLSNSPCLHFLQVIPTCWRCNTSYRQKTTSLKIYSSPCLLSRSLSWSPRPVPVARRGKSRWPAVTPFASTSWRWASAAAILASRQKNGLHQRLHPVWKKLFPAECADGRYQYAGGWPRLYVRVFRRKRGSKIFSIQLVDLCRLWLGFAAGVNNIPRHASKMS